VRQSTDATGDAQRHLQYEKTHSVRLDLHIAFRLFLSGRATAAPGVRSDSRSRAWDGDLGAGREFARKVRTLSGNYQLLQLAPWLLTSANPIRLEFVSHKLLRLMVPFALAGTLVASAMLHTPLYQAALVLQVGFYGLSGLAIAQVKKGRLARMADAVLTFVVLNTAAVVAFVNFVSGRKAAWIR